MTVQTRAEDGGFLCVIECLRLSLDVSVTCLMITLSAEMRTCLHSHRPPHQMRGKKGK